IDGLLTIAVNGDAGAQTGVGVHVYAFNEDMTDRFFYSADGEILIVPQLGARHLRTEFGEIDVEGGEIAVIPRGIKFQVRKG
ncbi:homogentisate 1,2-dioxygenase, partial [Klebsiella pneumoniae]|uniref:homogentisate 1,2-dioxygenase n=1 Tax=Klebsiella pneumoniae TaxID=573 RepID=UPI00272EFF4F